MTDTADLAYAVLLRVAEMIKKLPADQLADLAAGTAKLEVVPKGGRPAKATAKRAAAVSPVPTDEVRAELKAIGDPAAAMRYLTDLTLTVPGYTQLAKDLGVTIASKARKDTILREIVYWTVGRRLDSEAISRPAPARI